MAKKVAAYLPEELLTNIFLRLGVKSLLRCKSVCRTWLSVISNPHFVLSQLHRAMMNTTLLIIQNPRLHAETDMRKRISISNYPSLVLPRAFERCEVISCSYNGIVCLCDDHDVFYLWNPSIGEFKTLPPAPHRCLTRFDKIGFGYDSISGDYKIVMMVYENLSDVTPKVHLYSTNADSWRELQDTILMRLKGYDTTDIVVNGVLYFDNVNELISFDLHNEVLGLVPLPSIITRKMSNVLDFDGSLSMVFESDGDAPGIYLWMLLDVSGQMQWSQSIRINTSSNSSLRLYCYLGAGFFYGVMSVKRSYYWHNILYDYGKEETKIYGLRENERNNLEDHPLIEANPNASSEVLSAISSRIV